jgi:UDP-glucose 4-epimerase
MNILLTGGAGYIGSHTAVVLSEAGHNVVLLDNFCNSKKSILDRIETILGKSMPCIEADVRDTGFLEKVLHEFKIDAVIHFAGLKAVGESVAKPIDYYANNVQGALSLIQAMSNACVKTLIFSSSATVYGVPQYLPIDEDHPTDANNPYGRCKLHIEEMLKDIANSDPDWRIICLRYFNPVGAHKSGLIGEDPNGLPNNLMPYVAQVATGKLPHLFIYGNDYSTTDGTGVRDYIHVMDLAEGHMSSVEGISKMPGWHCINLGTGKPESVLNMVEMFEKVSGKSIDRLYKPRRSGDVAVCYASVGKAEKLLKWKSHRTAEDMCRSAWSFASSCAGTDKN